jgi:hypothetical protein
MLAAMIIGLGGSPVAVTPATAARPIGIAPIRPAHPGTLQGSSLYGYGRCLVNGNGQLELISGAAHAGFTFRG